MKWKKILTISFACLLFTSCNVLDQKPKTAVSSGNIIHNESTARIALNGLYSQLQNGNYYGLFFIMMAEELSDITQVVGTLNFNRELDTYSIAVTNATAEGFWEQAYATINQANFIISKVSKLDNISTEAKEQILGETYFIRALAYFDLNRVFGGVKGVYGSMGVPIVLKPTAETGINKGSYPSRLPINEVYAQVESDLKNAIELLPATSNNPTRASEAAAKALLARLYLYYKQDYALVEKYASQVINNYNYKLTEDYASIFIEEETVGSIFELTFTVSDQSDIRHYYFPPAKGGRQEVIFHKEFVNLLKSRPKDERADLMAYNKSSGAYYPTKYRKKSGKDNMQILRLAEIYLIRAEARARQDNLKGAIADLNAVRNRAGLPDTTGAGVDTVEEILDAIALERKIEFFAEGHRWFFLVRTGRALNVLQDVERKLSAPVSLRKGQQVMPIPQRAMDANPNLKQNKAYR